MKIGLDKLVLASKWCGSINNGYICNRSIDHDGEHRAYLTNDVFIFRWPKI